MRNISLILIAFLFATALQAQIIHVPGDYPTIQQGVEAATNGDTVLVAENTYYEQINFLGKAITLASQFLLDGDTSHIGKTIIDGSQITDPDSGSIVYFISGEDTTSILCGFTLKNGTIGTLDTTSGYIIRSGGAVYVSGSGAKIRHNHITNNSIADTLPGTVQITYGAGISAGQWIEGQHWVVIDHNTIDYNSLYSDKMETFGAGICVTCNTRITNNVISENMGHAIGSAKGGTAGFFAGGSLSWTNLSAEIRNNIIRNNHTIGGYSWAGGAGGMLQCNSVIFSSNTVENNVVSSNSFNIMISQGAIKHYAPRTGTIFSGNTFRNNKTPGCGGALYLEFESQNIDSDTVLVEGNYFVENESSLGGAMFTYNNPVVFQNNVFSRNLASTQGGAIRLHFLQSGIHNAILKNNSFSENQSLQWGGAISSLNGNPLIINSVFWNDSSDALYGPEIYMNYSMDTAEIAYSNIDLGKISGSYLDGGGNLAQDPLFTDPELLSIPKTSPCYNVGAPEYTCTCGTAHVCPASDISGNPRPLYENFDMGAHEYLAGPGIWGPPQGKGFVSRVSPNPVSTVATITYTLAEPCTVTITVFNSFGQLIAIPLSSPQMKGDQQVSWDTENLPAGIYLYRIEAGKKVGTGKFVKM